MDLSVPSAKGAHGIKLLFQVLNAAFFSSDKLARAVATWAAVTGAEGVFPGLLAFWINDGRFGMFGRAGADIFGRVGSYIFGRLGSVTFGREGTDMLGMAGSVTVGANVVLDPEVP